MATSWAYVREYAPRRFPAIVIRIRGYNSGDPDGSGHSLAVSPADGVVMTGVRAPACGSLLDSQRDGASGAPPGWGRPRLRRGWTLSRPLQRALRIGEVRVAETWGAVSSVRLPFRVHIERLYNSLMSRHSAIDQNHDERQCFSADNQFVGVRMAARLDSSVPFPALTACTLQHGTSFQSHNNNKTCRAWTPPIAVTFLLFVNGQLIVTGVRSVEHINAALQNIETMVNRSTYRR
ncbi:hypothetical protein niasHT_033772 [Heterodera trifolii]|uniref:Uncharacterized protein n=1 Tax=Heterodera trifolii TaxID=157864 RepID=A0ABD2IVV9_9BILA